MLFCPASYRNSVKLMMSPPCFQSHSMPKVIGPASRSLENDIWKSGLASPTTPSVPTIWVAERPGWIRNAPSEVPNPPVSKAGRPPSERIWLRLRKKVVRSSQLMFWLCTGDTLSEASTPRFLSRPSELKIRVSCPRLGAMVACRIRLVIIRW